LKQLISSSRLHLAAWAGHAEVVRCLCNHKADVGAAAMDDTAAIHFASQKGHVEVVRELLASGASVKAKNRKGLTALHLAAQNSHLDLVKYLVKKGADITVKTKGGQTALHVAEGDDVYAFLKECEQSLKKGAEPTSVKKDGSLSTTTKKVEDKSSSEVKEVGDDAGLGEKRKNEVVAGSTSPEVKKAKVAKVSLGHLVRENDTDEEEE
jgi:ankyrin repeat protein